MAIKEGRKTTEHKLSIAAMITSILMPVVATAIFSLQDSGVVTNPTAMIALSVIATVLTALGYGGYRTALKYQSKQAETALKIKEMDTGENPTSPSSQD